MSNLFRSLFLTALLSFMTPLLLLGGVLASLLAVSYIPGIGEFGQFGEAQLLTFLSIFGDGYPLQGMLTIGVTCSTVAGLFDVFNFYLYQDARGHY